MIALAGIEIAPPGKLPICTTVPPRRTLEIADVNPAAVPETSKATSNGLVGRKGLEASFAGRDVHDVVGAETLRKGKRRSRHVDDGDFRHSGELRRQQRQKADRTGAEDDAPLALRPRLPAFTAWRQTARGSASAAAAKGVRPTP